MAMVADSASRWLARPCALSCTMGGGWRRTGRGDVPGGWCSGAERKSGLGARWRRRKATGWGLSEVSVDSNQRMATHDLAAFCLRVDGWIECRCRPTMQEQNNTNESAEFDCDTSALIVRSKAAVRQNEGIFGEIHLELRKPELSVTANRIGTSGQS
jgi:hypothetical protein